MAEIKAYEFDRFLPKAVDLYRIFLIYGPDRGLVSERASALASKAGVKADDPFSFTKLEFSDLQGDPGRLVDEVNSLGLFGGAKLIWVKGSGADKALTDGLQTLLSLGPPDNLLLIEAGDLKKTSALRKLCEAGKFSVAVPCYADDAKALNQLIDEELATEKLRIAPDARERLLSVLGGDRVASRNEIRKLVLYCRGSDMISEEQVTEIIGDASAISTDNAVDCILKGDVAGLHHALQKITASKTPIFLVLQACLKQFQLLDGMRNEMNEKRTSAAQIMQTTGRHIHFKRKPLFEKALRNWSEAALAREANRLQNAILQSRQRSVLEDTIAAQTLLATALQSARAQNR
ncbi:DNA polymerase III subunit delta [Rhizobium sp. SSA_523]|uniref:DNA polymerase III subunit delta n=1 Tax=Rhizobium sp. SSA_523 TaxID=2952477 RepID=UPI002090E990|nr:DNA polymerase III subunit delta [Rhizobium sp. SSA_523]MCO5734611.1 DNA polymerase III subunit delta [Rhizobium sp. SSA_523]WKC23387.1 DNA polymerase III subunit delta [Rhizobium sp. SSA_523]